MKTVLITGGTGFIGSHTASLFLEKGYNIIIIDSLVNSSPNVIDRLKKINKDKGNKNHSKLEFIKGDLRDEYFLDNCFRSICLNNPETEIASVIHFAGLKSVNESTNDPIKYWDFNLKGTINLLKCMEKYNCTNLVFSSSATIYGVKKEKVLIDECSEIKPINPYGNTKAAIEQILKDLSESKKQTWRIASLRYFNPIGAHESGLIGDNPLDIPNNILPIINKVAAGLIDELKIFGKDWDTHDGTGIRDYIHVMDLAYGHLMAYEYLLNGKSNLLQINLGTGKGTSVLELVDTFQKVNNVTIPYSFASRREGDVAYSVADNSFAKRFLNWSPSRNLEAMCSDSWRWFKRNPEGL